MTEELKKAYEALIADCAVTVGTDTDTVRKVYTYLDRIGLIDDDIAKEVLFDWYHEVYEDGND